MFSFNGVKPISIEYIGLQYKFRELNNTVHKNN